MENVSCEFQLEVRILVVFYSVSQTEGRETYPIGKGTSEVPYRIRVNLNKFNPFITMANQSKSKTVQLEFAEDESFVEVSYFNGDDPVGDVTVFNPIPKRLLFFLEKFPRSNKGGSTKVEPGKESDLDSGSEVDK